MSVRRYVQMNGKLYERGTEPVSDGVMFMPDIQPYQSMITGEMITSRAKHREHLRKHGCQEVGDQAHTMKPPERDVNPQGRKDLIRAQFDAMSHRDFKRALQRDIDRIKWNSRDPRSK